MSDLNEIEIKLSKLKLTLMLIGSFLLIKKIAIAVLAGSVPASFETLFKP